MTPTERLTFDDAQILRLESASIAEPADRHVLRAAVVSLAGTMFFGFCTDPDALTDLGLIAGGVERSIDELLARAGSV